MKVSVMGVYFDDYTLAEFIDYALSCIDKGEKCTVVTPNAEIGLECKKNPALFELVNRSTLVLPDGISVKMAAKIIGAPITQKAAGIEFSEGMCAELAKREGSIFLFGAKPGVAEVAAAKLCEKYPGLKIAGVRNGYFSEDQEYEIVEQITEAKPDLLLVCLGAPKQEFFIDKHKDKLPACVMVGAGGSIDVFAGNVKRAPKIFIKLGLEWFYRLCKEPKRIKRMIKLPLYLWYALIWKMRGDKNNA